MGNCPGKHSRAGGSVWPVGFSRPPMNLRLSDQRLRRPQLYFLHQNNIMIELRQRNERRRWRRREEQRPGTQHAACQLHNGTAFLFAPEPVKHTGLITTVQAAGTSLTLTMGQARSKEGQNFIAQGRTTAQFLPLMFKKTSNAKSIQASHQPRSDNWQRELNGEIGWGGLLKGELKSHKSCLYSEKEELPL